MKIESVNGRCDAFLAGSALSRDEHLGIGLRDELRFFERLAKRLAFTDNVIETAVGRLCRRRIADAPGLEGMPVERDVEHHQQIPLPERLYDESVRPGGLRRFECGLVRIGGNVEEGNALRR